MSTLLLHLPLAAPGPHTEYSYTLTADGHSAVRHGSCAPALLPTPGRAGETVAVVPVQALSWQRVTLPQNLPLANAPRLRAVLEGLLEDRLLDDPAQLHFALQPGARAGEAAWVAVCDRAWLQQHLQLLEAAGRPVARVVPEFAPLADGATYCALGTPDAAWLLATGLGAGQGLALLPLATAPALLPPTAAGEEPPPVLADPAVAALAEQTLGRTVALATAGERALRAARGTWDLAQLDLASRGRARLLRKSGSLAGALLRAPQWRAARWAVGLLAAVHLVGLNAWAWQERQSLAAKQASVRGVLTQTFPQVKVVVDAPVQMERELAALRQSAGSLGPGDLEPMMAATGQALQAALPGVRPQALEYANNELRLRGIDPEGDALATLQERLATAGYRAQPDDGALVVRVEDGQ